AVGEYPDVSIAGVTDNDASSVQVQEGYIVELYSETNFGGEVFILEESDANLVASNFNDQVSSIKIYALAEPPGPSMATLFQNGS
ncbi:hypothetical protein, partial [Klebsiella pneumoniae]|uniref:hypothetical protein n=1 Tax=Klebsiella pneumoniae TaxID=573 RepID=UPI00194F02EA